MKRYIAIAALAASCVLHAAESSTNLLSIHLVDVKLFHQWHPDDIAKSYGASVLAAPVLADSDFVSFDVTNHSFVVTPEAAKRVAKSIWDVGKRDAPGWGDSPTILRGGAYELIPTPAPFVLKASGTPIYWGAFSTPVSSRSFAGPVILPDVLFITGNLMSNVTFRIKLGYPGASPGVDDPRCDSRIVSAAQKLFAHEKK